MCASARHSTMVQSVHQLKDPAGRSAPGVGPTWLEYIPSHALLGTWVPVLVPPQELVLCNVAAFTSLLTVYRQTV